MAVPTPPNPKKNSKSKYKNSIIFVHNDKRVNKRETKPWMYANKVDNFSAILLFD